MDFHSLTRRELQALCKKNKIPANMTNIAMADALNALDHVEELSDNLETIHATPNRLEILSPALPRTTRRASARSKSEAETETKGTNKVSETSETPVSRIGRRRGAVPLVLPKMKEENKGGDEVGQKENLAVPVHSVRRSTRFADKKTSQSTQKKGSRRAEAVKIPVFSEEEAENLEGQPKVAEIPDVEEDKETKSMISGEVLNNTSETSLAESSVVESGDATRDDDVYVTEPNDDVHDTESLVAEVQKSLTFATKENEQDHLHGEPEQLEVEDGSAHVQECISGGKICNSTSKDSVAETSSSMESVFDDLIVNEQYEAGEGSEGDDKNTIFVVQNQENQSGEGLAVEEDKVTSDWGSTEGESYEIHPLESTCLNLCSREDPEVIGKDECNCGSTVAAMNDLAGEIIVEVLSEAEVVSYLSPEKMDVTQPQDNPQNECDQSAGQLVVLQLEAVANHFAKVLQLQNDDLASDQQQKMNAEEVGADVADHFAELGGKLTDGSDVAESSEEEKSCENVDVSSLCSVEQDEKPSHEEHYNVAATTEDVTGLEKIPLLNDHNAFISKLHLEGTISLPDHPANDVVTTPTPRKSQTPRKSGNKKRTTPRQLMVFEDNKENTSEISATKLSFSVASPNVFEDNKENTCEISATKLGLSVASPKTARLEMGKKKAISILSPERYQDKSRRQLIKMIKEKEKLLENKRPALQTLNEN